MKFDVVIGNPPYQDNEATSSKKLWPVFIRKSMSLLKDTGYLAMISPSSWMAGNSDVFELFKKHKCHYLDTNISHHFNGVGSTFSAYCLEKGQNVRPIITRDGTYIDFTTMPMLPRTLNNMSISIIDKVTCSKDKLEFIVDSFAHSQRTDKISKKRGLSHIYPIKHGAESLLWSNVVHPIQKKSKVMMYMSGKPKPFYDDGNYGQSQHHCSILCSKKFSKNLIDILTSKIIRFYLYETTYAQAWNKVALRKIGSVDFSHNWTDEELYKHFNLTQEEIDYIEANVK